jgi:hypothetical protein
LVQRTVVPRSETSASSKSYSVWQRLQVISIGAFAPAAREVTLAAAAGG